MDFSCKFESGHSTTEDPWTTTEDPWMPHTTPTPYTYHPTTPHTTPHTTPTPYTYHPTTTPDELSPECRKLVGRKRIRKEVNRLTRDEKSVLNNAMKKAMNPHPDNGFSI